MHEFHEEDEDYFCRFTFGQFVSIALLEVVALFFVFYLGSRYGPGLMGHETATGTDHLAIAAQETLPSADQAATQPTPVVHYTFPKELTQPARPVVSTAPSTRPAPINTTKKLPVPVEKRGGYSIQVGSYRQAGGAAAKVNHWQSKGYDAFLSIGEVANSGTWYRVRIGHFGTREGARKFLEQLSQREKISAIIVRLNT